MAVTGNQQVKHPGGCRPIIDKLLFCQLLWVDDPDGGGQPLILVNHTVPHHRDPYLIGQMSHHNGLRESMQAINAANTGHSVITTIHANSCADTYYRMVTLCKQSYGFSGSSSSITCNRYGFFHATRLTKSLLPHTEQFLLCAKELAGCLVDVLPNGDLLALAEKENAVLPLHLYDHCQLHLSASPFLGHAVHAEQPSPVPPSYPPPYHTNNIFHFQCYTSISSASPIPSSSSTKSSYPRVYVLVSGISFRFSTISRWLSGKNSAADHCQLHLSASPFLGHAVHAEWDSGQVGWIYAALPLARANRQKPAAQNAIFQNQHSPGLCFLVLYVAQGLLKNRLGCQKNVHPPNGTSGASTPCAQTGHIPPLGFPAPHPASEML